MDLTITALVVACTSLASNLALLVKVITGKIKLTAERTGTKTAREPLIDDSGDKLILSTGEYVSMSDVSLAALR